LGILALRGLTVSDKGRVRYFQEPLFEELKKDYCYVCYRRIKNNDGIYIGNSMWRHKKCKPGGNTWLKSRIGRESTLLNPSNSETSS
jgi:hypothetical protein